MHYTATKFFNPNENKVKYKVEIVFDDNETGSKEAYADDIKSEADLENVALSLVVGHETELATRAEEKAKAEAAIAEVSFEVLEPRELTMEKVENYKVAVETARLEAIEAAKQAELPPVETPPEEIIP